MGVVNVGKYTYGFPELRGDMNSVFIGNFCSIAKGVICDGGFNHNLNYVSTYPFPTKVTGCDHLGGHVVCKGDIHIHNDVWIGENALIMSGVTIGDGAVIGYGSIVTKDVKPYEIVVGAPARHVRFRFKRREIEMLREIKWWDWPDELIKQAAHLLMSDKIENLYNFYLKHKP